MWKGNHGPVIYSSPLRDPWRSLTLTRILCKYRLIEYASSKINEGPERVCYALITNLEMILALYPGPSRLCMLNYLANHRLKSCSSMEVRHRTKTRPGAWWDSRTQKLLWLTCHIFLTNSKAKTCLVWKGTLRKLHLQVWSLPEAVRVSALVSHPLIIMHQAHYASSPVLGKWMPSFWEAVGMVKINATFGELNDLWSNDHWSQKLKW